MPWLSIFFKIPEFFLSFSDQQNCPTFPWFPAFPWPVALPKNLFLISQKQDIIVSKFHSLHPLRAKELNYIENQSDWQRVINRLCQYTFPALFPSSSLLSSTCVLTLYFKNLPRSLETFSIRSQKVTSLLWVSYFPAFRDWVGRYVVIKYT